MNADQYRNFIKEVLPPLGYQWRRFDRRNTRRKIQRRMEHLGIHEPGEYAALLAEDPEECRLFEYLLPVTITRFFRNAWLWAELGMLLSEAGNVPEGQRQILRLWSAGCGGGEEAYTAAMLLEDAFKSDISGWPWTVLGTDIDQLSLERSCGAEYGWGVVREVPPLIRQRWFSEEEGTWTLDRKIRDFVQIRRHDIVREDPPGAFHVVLLRNSILTYNTERVQREVLSKVHGCLLVPGLLVIGRTEKLPEGTGFEEVGRCIYRKV
jgi:chemotaxis methyl-accepting protein methylase